MADKEDGERFSLVRERQRRLWKVWVRKASKEHAERVFLKNEKDDLADVRHGYFMN